MTLQDARTTVLAERLTAVRQRIEAAAGTSTAPTLIVVTKFHPAADVVRLRSLGVADVGENRDQEAAAKAVEVADADLRWHFIGQLQSNKAKSVAAYAQSVHSIDRGSLVTALGKAVAIQQQATGRADLECFIQLDLSEAYPGLADAQIASHSGRGGVAPSDMARLADQIAATEGLILAGVMAVAPLGVAPEPAFCLLAETSAALIAQHPGARAISAGMSHDLEAAMAVGATHLRVGSDILGPRPAVL
ncbi:YggS family pyridoxal phosphate enzyme [Arthrobacter psychrolactophilus]|uniref:YggS family pyridoxal phosphate enzyme n=1 Tax=Arthrobacter psychrolactophilus TaxID=92442 RepID=A0A2V5J753_9MICC|nr:alanine racemase [Arthrobacter psychrolactophilus]PYI38590.1 YggS family pyridoxal phosphate enzyme [Arthrobacter psychrolactophilus]